jgi:hypothetical protein
LWKRKADYFKRFENDPSIKPLPTPSTQTAPHIPFRLRHHLHNLPTFEIIDNLLQDENQETVLLRATLLNAQATRQYAASEFDQLASLYESARELLTGIQPKPDLEAFYQSELARTFDGCQ